MIAQTPKPPYYAVIFTSVRTDEDNGYAEMSERMTELVQQLDGFLGWESARDEIGITVSYWRDLESIRNWRNNSEHLQAQLFGKRAWYRSYKVRVVRVEKDYGFEMK
jgi:heme-degrading monooxygenase HmoA